MSFLIRTQDGLSIKECKELNMKIEGGEAYYKLNKDQIEEFKNFLEEFVEEFNVNYDDHLAKNLFNFYCFMKGYEYSKEIESYLVVNEKEEVLAVYDEAYKISTVFDAFQYFAEMSKPNQVFQMMANSKEDKKTSANMEIITVDEYIEMMEEEEERFDEEKQEKDNIQ